MRRGGCYCKWTHIKPLIIWNDDNSSNFTAAGQHSQWESPFSECEISFESCSELCFFHPLMVYSHVRTRMEQTQMNLQDLYESSNRTKPAFTEADNPVAQIKLTGSYRPFFVYRKPNKIFMVRISSCRKAHCRPVAADRQPQGRQTALGEPQMDTFESSALVQRPVALNSSQMKPQSLSSCPAFYMPGSTSFSGSSPPYHRPAPRRSSHTRSFAPRCAPSNACLQKSWPAAQLGERGKGEEEIKSHLQLQIPVRPEIVTVIWI